MTNTDQKYALVLAIDGPSGSGKSTVAKKAAAEMNLVHIDTGAMFRALGYHFNSQGVELTSEALVGKLDDLLVKYCPSDGVLIEINGVDLTQKIREHQVSGLASQISQIPMVRKFLLNFQRELASQRPCVMEGRDIGTVVFPDAFCKIFLTASADIRATRRLKELEERGETGHSLEELKKDVIERDEKDRNRTEAPLKQASDAILLDTSDLTLEQVIAKVVTLAKDKAKSLHLEL